MMPPDRSASSLRVIAEKLGLSASTVSRALHQDPRISAETTRRVMEALKEDGYQLDPIVSLGMTKIRQRNFYRETIAWCSERPQESQPWFQPLFASAEDYGTRLGYEIDYFHVKGIGASQLSQLARMWKARGIRGVLLGPFLTPWEKPLLPWNDFAWVVIGAPIENSGLHSVGRDLQADLAVSLRWLEEQNCRRVCFLSIPEAGRRLDTALLQASLLHYHGIRRKPKEPIFEPDPKRPEEFQTWLARNSPDGLILPTKPGGELMRLLQPVLDSLPTVYLTSWQTSIKHRQACFHTRFEVMGPAAVNFMHRLLSSREFGIPSYQQSILVNSDFVTVSRS